MPSSVNQQILLKSRPTGEPTESDFALVETAIPEPGKRAEKCASCLYRFIAREELWQINRSGW